MNSFHIVSNLAIRAAAVTSRLRDTGDDEEMSCMREVVGLSLRTFKPTPSSCRWGQDSLKASENALLTYDNIDISTVKIRINQNPTNFPPLRDPIDSF
jgi:hypothetical protein